MDEGQKEYNPKEHRYPCRVYRELQVGEQLVVFCDPADTRDQCALVAFSKKHFDYPVVYNEVTDSGQFGYEIYNICKYIYNRTSMWPRLAVEKNTGQATIFVLKNLNYPNLFRMIDPTAVNQHEGGTVGWITTGSLTAGELQGTRRKMLDELSLGISQGIFTIYDYEQIKQLQSFVIVKGRAQAQANKKDDLVMATAGAWQIAQLTPDEDFGDYDEEAIKKEKDKWRFK